MEAAPRLPMISFELKTSTEPVSFASKLKQYIASYYHEDPESYSTETQQLEQLRSAAVRPTNDVNGVQTLKRYYCQLRYLRSRFPMEKNGICAVQFSWKDTYAGIVCSAADLSLELMSILYNIGALHSQLGASDSRQTPEGMKMACTHFQCAAWAFQQTRELYPPQVALSLAPEVLHFMELTCLAQAQECILEKSMMDSRKSTIIAKVASQAVDYYQQAGQALTGSASHHDNADIGDIIGGRIVKDWCRYLRFKSAYHGCVSLLFQGQCSEEQQKMGERCALYQAASERLEEARKIASSGGKLAATCTSGPSGGSAAAAAAAAEIDEALAFTQDVVEGKRKAARNENEFIYHEVVPEKDALPALQGASLVRPVPFGVQDPDVSGPDIFGRLVPMEAHEASSIYSERKAELLRSTGAAVDQRDRELEEFMSSLQQTDVLVDRLQRPQLVPQEVVDRAAALSARPHAAQQLIDAMGRLSAVHHDVDALLNEAQTLIDHEREEALNGDRDAPPSMPMTDLGRECAKYREALSKASESNEALHKAMMTHVSNLKILGQPLSSVDKHIPRVGLPDPQSDGPALEDLRRLLAKVDEMRQQRGQLLAELRDAIRCDDITGRIVMQRERPVQELERLFEAELAKHRPRVSLIEQNLSAQQNILMALTEAYAKVSQVRKHVSEQFRRRDQIVAALIASYDAYDDLLAKANKGIDFYQKLETNVTKLLQRLRSTCRVQQEEREQKSTAQNAPQAVPNPSTPKLRDYLQQPRPAPLGSEHTDITKTDMHRVPQYPPYQQPKSQPYQVTPMMTGPMSYPTQNIPTQYPQMQTQIANSTQYAKPPTPVSQVPTYYNTSPKPQVRPEFSRPTPVPTYNYYSPQGGTVNNSNQYSSQNFTQPTAYSTQTYSQAYSNPSTETHTSQASVTQVYGASQTYTGQVPTTYGTQSIYGPPIPTTQNYSATINSQYPNNYPVTQPSPVPDKPIVSHAVAQPVYNKPIQQFTGYGQPSSSYTSQTPTSTYVHQPSYPGQPINQKSYGSQRSTPYTPQGTYVNQQNYGNQQQNYPNQNYPTQQTYPNQPNTYGTQNYGNQPYGQQPFYPPQPSTSTYQPNAYPYPQNNPPNPTQYPPNVDQSYHMRGGFQSTPNQSVSSNVDLLSGLDFNVSQIPLDPVKAETGPLSPITEKTVSIKEIEPIEKLQPEPFQEPEADIDSFERSILELESWLFSPNADFELEKHWRELQQRQEKDTDLRISVARCYPNKNRCPDSLPYDRNRVELPVPPAVDDYINASRVPQFRGCPELLITQTPLPSTAIDFWRMVSFEKCSTVICLVNQEELTEAGLPNGYWLSEYGANVRSGTENEHWIERAIAILDGVGGNEFLVRHLQLKSTWPTISGETAIIGALSAFVKYIYETNNPNGRLVVHCLTGMGRSGVLSVALRAIIDGTGNRLTDVQETGANLALYRRNVLRDRLHLEIAQRVVLRLARTKLPLPIQPAPTLMEIAPPPEPKDPLSDLDPLWKLKL